MAESKIKNSKAKTNKVKITPYDKQKVYDEIIREKAEELRDLCYEHDIPVFFTAAVRNTAKDTLYESFMITDDTKGLKLKNDHIADMVKVLNNFFVVRAVKPVPIREAMEEMEMPDMESYTCMSDE